MLSASGSPFRVPGSGRFGRRHSFLRAHELKFRVCVVALPPVPLSLSFYMSPLRCCFWLDGVRSAIYKSASFCAQGIHLGLRSIHYLFIFIFGLLVGDEPLLRSAAAHNFVRLTTLPPQGSTRTHAHANMQSQKSDRSHSQVPWDSLQSAWRRQPPKNF